MFEVGYLSMVIFQKLFWSFKFEGDYFSRVTLPKITQNDQLRWLKYFLGKITRLKWSTSNLED